MPLMPRPETWDDVAQDYGAEATPAARALAREVTELLRREGLTPPRRLLEAGCGSGHISLELRRAGYDTDLLDFSEVALGKARAAYRAAFGEETPSQFIAGDLLELGAAVAPQSYDVVWNSGVLEHFSRDRLETALAQMGAAARERVLFIVPNPESLVYLAYRAKMLAEQRWDVGVEFLRSDYETAAAAAGLRPAGYGYCGAEYTRAWLAYVVKSPGDRRWFEAILASGQAAQGTAYLQYFVYAPDTAATPAPRADDDRETLDRTFYLDALGTANGALASMRRLVEQAQEQAATVVGRAQRGQAGDVAALHQMLAQREEEVSALLAALALTPLAEVAVPAQLTGPPPPVATTVVNIVSYLFFDRDGQQLMGGGAERYLPELSRVVRELGFEPHIYQCGNEAWERSYEGTPVHGLPTYGDNRLLNALFHQAAPPGALTIYSAFDVAEPLCHARALGISHGIFWDHAGYQTPAETQALRRALANCAHVVSVDANTINWVRATHRDLADRFTYIPNFVDTDLFRPQPRASDGRCVVLYPRRLYRPRGFWLLAEVVPELLARHAELEFRFVGQADPEEARRMDELRAQFGDKVQHDSLQPDEMVRAYQNADITVIPTVASEGTSLSCLEALACGNAVVVTDVGGLPELVCDGFNGLVISPTAAALQDALEHLIADRDTRRRLGENARRSAEAYSKSIWQERWRRTLRRFLTPEPTETELLAAFEVVHPRSAGQRWDTLPARARQLMTAVAARGLRVHMVEDQPTAAERREAGGVHVLGAQAALRVARPVLYLHDARSYPAVLEFERPIVVYHILEDPRQRVQDDGEAPPGYLRYHQALLRDADVVLTGEPRLAERYGELRPDIVLLEKAGEADASAGEDTARVWVEQVLTAVRAAAKRGFRTGGGARREVWERIAALRVQSRVWHERWKELTTWTERLHTDHKAKCAETAQLWSQVQELSQRAAELDQAYRRVDEQLRDRTAELRDKTAELRDKTAEADRIWRTYCEEKDKAEAAAQQVTRQAAELHELLATNQELYTQLRGIFASTGWHLLQGLYRVRFFLFPRGSQRERAAKWFMRKQRGLRLRARPGRRGSSQAPAHTEPVPPALPGAALPVAVASAVQAGEPGLVSVVLPVYNQANMLRESIESVLAQTYPEFELIVIDDGSPDGVERVLGEYAGHPKVRVLSQPNQKLPKALSNGFEFARGEFWTWTSADNLMEPQQLEKQVAFLRAHPDVELVYCDYLAIDDRGQPLADQSFRPHNRRSPESPEIHLPRSTATLHTRDDNFIGACFLYRGWVGRALGDYAPDLGVEDFDYWLRMNRLFRVAHLGTDDVLYRYRVHDNTLSAHAPEHRIAERVQRLMTYEQERAAFYARPWTIYVDTPTRAWLEPFAGEHTLRDLSTDGARIEGAADEKLLILVRADALTALGRRAPTAAACVAVWFDSDPRAPYALAAHVRRHAHVCFVPDAVTAARLEQSVRPVLRATPGPTLFATALAFANNRVFFRATNPPDRRARTLPRVYTPPERRLRVLLQVDHFLQGGFERVVLDLAQALDRQRYEPALLSLGREGAAVEEARALGLRYLRLPPGDPDAAYRELLLRERFDLVNAHCAPQFAATAAALGVPFIQTVHSAYVGLDAQQRAVHRAADPHTRAYVCVSTAAAAYADLRLGFGPERMIIIPNGINTEAIAAARARVDRSAERAALGFAPEAFVFLHVGSIYPPKGHHLLVAALARARQRNPHIQVAFLGAPMDKPYARRVRTEAARLGVGAAVHWLGFQPDPQRFYAVCDGFVLPSFVEGWSLALAEALCAGLPIVASDVGAARDVLDGLRHWLVPPPVANIEQMDLHTWYRLVEHDHPAFVAALAEALCAAAESNERCELSPERARRLDRRWAYQAYLHVFEWLVAGGHAAAARPWVWALHDEP